MGHEATESKRSVTLSLSESLVDLLDEAVSDSPDYLSLSRSELLRYAVEQGVEEAGDDVEDLLPDEILAKYRTKRETERIKAKHYVVDKREGWRGRVKSYLNARLSGEEPYHPEGVRALAEGYREELRMLDRLSPTSSRTVDEDLAWLDESLDAYEQAHRAKEVVPDSRPFVDVDDAIATGHDVESLRGDLGALVDDLAERAESEAYDPDAIVRSLAQDYAVDESAVEVVLDVLLPEDVDPRAALKGLDDEDASVDDVFPSRVIDDVEDAPALDDSAEWSEPTTYEGSERTDLPSETITVEVDDLKDDSPADVDEDAVEAIVEEQIRGGSDDD
jgi:hypothetical protein